MSSLSDPAPLSAPPAHANPKGGGPWRDARTYGVIALAGLCVSGVGFMSPALALAIGIGLALLGLVPTGLPAGRIARWLIQVSVVLLGTGMDLHELARAGATGMVFAAATIIGTFALGAAVGRLLGVDKQLITLLSAGTAVCGGSAIAATGSAIRASSAHMSVATAVVFLLNALALYLFPPIGKALSLSAPQFGAWSAVAIHDVSSVVGAAKTYDAMLAGSGAGGAVALTQATAIKLARTLWIIPIALVAAWAFARMAERDAAGSELPRAGEAVGADRASGSKLAIPWFIGLFVLAAGARTLWPSVAQPIVADVTLVSIAKRLMMAALMLIGMGLSVKSIRSVGWRALVLGVTLWIAISVVSLVVIRSTV